MTTYYTWTCDCIDPDELRDSADDGGCPTSICRTLYADANEAWLAAIEDANKELAEQLEPNDFPNGIPVYTADAIKTLEFEVPEISFIYNVIKFEVKQ